MNKPELNSEWKGTKGYTGTYKVVGFKTIWNGRHGVELVRFIKSRNAWATTPHCFSYLDIDPENRIEEEDRSEWDLFYNLFTQC